MPGGTIAQRERRRAELSVAFHYHDPLASVGIAVLHGWRLYPEARRTVLPVNHPGQGADTELGWLATASRHWNIDRPDPR